MTPGDFTSNVSRFWAKVQRDGPDECWPWFGEKNNQGYGRFILWHGRSRTRILTHRLSLQLAGAAVPDDAKVLHRCDNPPCVNPAHLRVGTQSDNMRDALKKGRLNLTGLELGQRLSTRELRERRAAVDA